MKLTSNNARLCGAVRIPASKSHTVRAVIFATLAVGESVIRHPLSSHDTRSALDAARGLGAKVTADSPYLWRITGTGGAPKAAGQTIDVGNSGTTLYIALATAALAKNGEIRFDGDEQIRRRSAASLLNALSDLGATATSEAGNGCCPITVSGTLKGGHTSIECRTSQHLSALLINAPFAAGDTRIDVPLLFEKPYVTMTLRWLEELGLTVDYEKDYSRFDIPGRQSMKSFDREIPADFSSATFFLVAAAATGSELLLQGLDMSDSQGDKAVVDYLHAMGATVTEEDGGLLVHAGPGLTGAELDLNATPDALPAMAVAACFAKGRTILGNVPQARIKETDRIAVMATELAKLGADVTELEDGLSIVGGGLSGGEVRGHGDHRIVMSFAIAGLCADGPVTVDTAEAAAVTFPNFVELFNSAGGRAEVE